MHCYLKELRRKRREGGANLEERKQMAGGGARLAWAGGVRGRGSSGEYCALSITKRGTRVRSCTASSGGARPCTAGCRVAHGRRGPGKRGKERGCRGPGSKSHVEGKQAGCRTASCRAVRRRTAAAGRGRSKGRSDRASDRLGRGSAGQTALRGRSDRPPGLQPGKRKGEG